MCIWQQCNRLCGPFANSLCLVCSMFFFLVFLDKSQRDFWVKHPLGTEKSFVLGWQVLYWVQLSQDNDSYTSAFSILTLYREFGLYQVMQNGKQKICISSHFSFLFLQFVFLFTAFYFSFYQYASLFLQSLVIYLMLSVWRYMFSSVYLQGFHYWFDLVSKYKFTCRIILPCDCLAEFNVHLINFSNYITGMILGHFHVMYVAFRRIFLRENRPKIQILNGKSGK